jgi:hypothetical protein
MKLNFNLNKNGKALAIFAVLRHKGEMERRYTGHAVPSEKYKGKAIHWDYDKQRAKHGAPDATLINRKLGDWQAMFDDYVFQCQYKKVEMSVSVVKDLLGGNKGAAPGTVQTLVDAFDLYLSAIEISHQETTATRYRVMKGQIEQYEKHTRKKVLLDDVGDDFYKKLCIWLAEHHQNKNPTMRRKIKLIKTVKTYALSGSKKMDFLKDGATKRPPLNPAERTALLNYRTEDLQERRIVDAFITAMYTGLRYSDLEQLSAVHVTSCEIDGSPEHYLSLTAEKTVTAGSIPLPNFLYERLRPYIKAGARFFNLPENSQANEVLKRVAKRLNLDRQIESRSFRLNEKLAQVKPLHEVISFHFARFTYTHIQDTIGIQATYIQQNLGHGTFATTEGYLQSDQMRRIQETNRMLQQAQ